MNKVEYESLQDAKIKIDKLEEELRARAEIIAAQKDSIAAILKDNDKLVVENANLKDEFAKLSDDNARLEKHYKLGQEENLRMGNIIADLRKENEALKDRFYATSGFIWTDEDDDTTTEDSITTTVTYSGSFPDPSEDAFPEDDDTKGCYLEGCIKTDPSEVSNYHAPQFNFTGPVIISGDKDIISDALDRYYTHLNGGYEPTDECSL